MMSDISRYEKQIPTHNLWKLDKELDYDNDLNRDLIEIAQYIINWEEDLQVNLGLTREDVHKIKQEGNIVFRQREVLSTWKEKQALNATYRNLLKCVAGKDHRTATKICELKLFKASQGENQSVDSGISSSLSQNEEGMHSDINPLPSSPPTSQNEKRIPGAWPLIDERCDSGVGTLSPLNVSSIVGTPPSLLPIEEGIDSDIPLSLPASQNDTRSMEEIAVKLKHTTLATPIKRPHPTTDTDDESGITKRPEGVSMAGKTIQ